MITSEHTSGDKIILALPHNDAIARLSGLEERRQWAAVKRAQAKRMKAEDVVLQ